MYTPPFRITDEILRLVAEISEQIGALSVKFGARMPLPMLRKENQIKTIHSSLAIEHNSLSLQQVTEVIEGKHVPIFAKIYPFLVHGNTHALSI